MTHCTILPLAKSADRGTIRGMHGRSFVPEIDLVDLPETAQIACFSGNFPVPIRTRQFICDLKSAAYFAPGYRHAVSNPSIGPPLTEMRYPKGERHFRVIDGSGTAVFHVFNRMPIRC